MLARPPKAQTPSGGFLYITGGRARPEFVPGMRRISVKIAEKDRENAKMLFLAFFP
jgi:hypothetical protein